MTAKVKNILPNLRGATISRRWIGFSEDDVNSPPKAQISGSEGVRLNCRANALSVKLRGGHAPLRRTTRSTTCLAPAMDEAKEWGEVSVPDQSLVLA